MQAVVVGRPKIIRMKPLFVPLKTDWFRAFQSGAKTVEFRRYGPRWNETTCVVGRDITLSLGYSGPRLYGVIRKFHRIASRAVPEATAIYGDCEIAAIEIDLRGQRLDAQEVAGLFSVT